VPSKDVIEDSAGNSPASIQGWSRPFCFGAGKKGNAIEAGELVPGSFV
jgi:hypothetical protein